MTLPHRWSRQDQGSALIELIFGISMLLVPMALGLVAVVSIGTGAALAESSAREVARGFVLADDDADAYAVAHRIAQVNFADAGREFVQPVISCTSRPCLSPGAHVVVRISFPVDVPWGRWRVSAEHVQLVDPWRAWR